MGRANLLAQTIARVVTLKLSKCSYFITFILIFSIVFLSGCGSGIFGTPGITLDSEQGLTTSENGDSINVTLVLDSAPDFSASISLESNDTGEVIVTPATITFDQSNWSTPQTITVTGVDDDIIDGNQIITIITHPIVSDDTNYGELNPKDLKITNSDNDMAGTTVSPLTLVLSENSELNNNSNFSIFLNTKPTDEVSIEVTTSDTTEVLFGAEEQADKLVVIFTPENWALPQVITAIANDDAIVDGTQNVLIKFENISSNDINYSGLTPQQISVAVNDDDSAGISINPKSNLQTSESGGQASFTVALNSQPTTDVTIGITSKDTSEGVVDKDSLKFTKESYHQSQEIIVSGIDDSEFDENQTYTITTHKAVSEDSAYNGINPEDVTVVNIDNESAISIVLSDNLNTSESGDISHIDFFLNKQPQSNVDIEVSTNSPTEGLISGGDSPSMSVESLTLTFIPEDWATSQRIIVLGQDDEIVDGNQSYNIRISDSSSDDSEFNGISLSDVAFINDDNDSGGLTINPATDLQTSEDGLSDTFSIALNSKPDGNVILDIASNDVTEGLVKLSSSITDPQEKIQLTFTPEDWSTSQTVTVIGVDDNKNDGDQSYSIIISPELLNTTDNTGYSSLSNYSISTININNYTGSQSEGTISEPVVLNVDEERTYYGTTSQTNSYYHLTDLIPNTIYDISLSILTDNVNLSLFSDNNFVDFFSQCYSGNTGLDDEACSIESNGSGEIWVKVSGNNTKAGATYSLTISDYMGLPSEGSQDLPMKLIYNTDFPHSGSVNILTSYYKITGLSPDTIYDISLSSVSAPVHLNVYSSHSWSSNECSIATTIFTGKVECSTMPNSEGVLWVKVSGSSTSSGAEYNLNVTSYIGHPSEGTTEIPRALSYESDFPYNGTTSPLDSFYVVTGLIPNTVYDISLSNLTDYLSFLHCELTGGGVVINKDDISCTLISDDSGNLSLGIDGTSNPEGSTFTLNIMNYAGLPSEGTEETPHPLSFEADLPHQGTTSPTSSYYRITGLIPNSIYELSLSNLTDYLSLDLLKYSNIDYVSWENCGLEYFPIYSLSNLVSYDVYSSNNSDYNNRSCIFSTDESGELIVRVNGRLNSSGSTFTLNVSEYSGVPSEGTSIDRYALSFESDLPHDGSTSLSGSYYQVSGLTPNTLYDILLSNLTDNLSLSINPTTGFYLWINNCGHNIFYFPGANYEDKTCTKKSDELGKLNINISRSSQVDGATFTLNLTEYSGPPSEGTQEEPLILPYDESFLHNGSTSPDGSYYKITGLNPHTLYSVFLTDETGTVAIRTTNTPWTYVDIPDWTTHTVLSEITANELGEIWIEVTNVTNTLGGATYELNIDPIN